MPKTRDNSKGKKRSIKSFNLIRKKIKDNSLKKQIEIETVYYCFYSKSL
jgi:hypothetical protein